jgi:4-hydroxy-4-methyl-2-oxoglutarate aldolase
MEEILNNEEFAALRKIDTPTICNAIELFEIRPRTAGYMDGRIRSAFPELPPMVGYATTATFRSAAPPLGADLYTTISKQVSHFSNIPEPRIVVFQDLDEPPAAATFGEVMCTIYQTFGCAGLITSGGGRDLPQVRALGFPVFIGSTICSHGYCHLLDVNVPVQVGGLTIHPGDLLHGDCNGVAVIPGDIARSLPSVCREFSAIEERLLADVRAGGADAEALRRARTEAAEETRRLGERLRSQRS